jgi:hypothetical protein
MATQFADATVVINGRELTEDDVMAMRIAFHWFDIEDTRLGDEKQSAAYRQRVRELTRQMDRPLERAS